MPKITSFQFATILLVGVSSSAYAQRVEQRPPDNAGAMAAVNRENVLQYDQFRERELNGGFIAQGYKMSRGEEKTLMDLQRKADGKDPQAAFTAVAKTAPSIKSPGGQYILSAIEMKLAGKLNDRGLQSRATDRAIGSGAAPAAIVPGLLQNQAVFALDDNDLAKAEGAYGRLVAMTPTDAEAMVSLGQIKADLGKRQEAAQLFDRAIALRRSSAQPVPDIWVQASNAVRGNTAKAK